MIIMSDSKPEDGGLIPSRPANKLGIRLVGEIV